MKVSSNPRLGNSLFSDALVKYLVEEGKNNQKISDELTAATKERAAILGLHRSSRAFTDKEFINIWQLEQKPVNETKQG